MGTTADNWNVGGNLAVTGTTALTGAATIAGALAVTGDLTAGAGRLCSFTFHQGDATASQSAVAITAGTGEDADATEYVIPWAGSIMGISVACEAARSGGSCIVDATVNGTVTGLTATIDDTDTQYAYGVQAKDSDAITAGQRLGVKVTTDAGWAAGTTPSILVTVFCEM